MSNKCNVTKIVEGSNRPRYKVEFELDYYQFWALGQLVTEPEGDHQQTVASLYDKACAEMVTHDVESLSQKKVSVKELNDSDEL